MDYSFHPTLILSPQVANGARSNGASMGTRVAAQCFNNTDKLDTGKENDDEHDCVVMIFILLTLLQ